MSWIVEILSDRQRKQLIGYDLYFQDRENKECGYGFLCDSDGNVLDDEHKDVWIQNYNYCITHPELYEYKGIRTWKTHYTEPAVGLCSCGEKVVLSGDCTCPKCGQWYNSFGQALRDPEYWESGWDDEY